MAKFRKYALIALAIVAFLTLMFLLYKGTQNGDAQRIHKSCAGIERPGTDPAGL